MVELTIATERYDRTIPLHDGLVRPEGLTVNWLALNVEQIFWRQLQHREFDASELSLASYIILRDQGVEDFVAIPIFLSRAFRHDCIYVNADAGIRAPQDLVGRRIGVPEYQITAAVFARGALEDDYGVRTEDLLWFQGGLEQPGRVPHTRVAPPGVRIEQIPTDRTLAAMLEAGELDALVSPRVPSTFLSGTGKVKRLLDDPWTAEREYFKRTGVFPIMHLFAIRKPVTERYPWVAQTLANAFTEAKKLADRDLRETAALPIGLPFLMQHTEETMAVMGHDFWPYGVEPNRASLEAAVRYLHRQGLISATPAIEDLFPASTQRTTRL